MLPSRGIVRSLPSAGARRQITCRQATPRTTTTLGTGRQYGTVRRSLGGANGLSPGSGFQLRARQAAGLGTVASTRNLSWPSFSLWGSGKKSEDPAAAATTTTTTNTPPAAEPVPTAAAPVEKAAESTSTVAAQATTAPSDGADLSAISDLVNTSGSEILNRSEDIGYLASLGLDYGWGPSSLMLWTIEHIHVWGGLGWAGSIVAAAVVVRLAMLYPLIQSTKFSADMKRLQEDPRFPEVAKSLKQAIATGDRTAQAQAQSLNSILRREYNVPFSKMGWSFLPIPFSYGLFRVVTGMTHIPVPSLESAGFLWFSDLTATDPYMVLPAVATGLMVVAIDLNARNSPKSQRGMAKKMKYVLVPVMLFGTSFLSAAVNLMGVSFGAATLGTTVFLNNNAVRRALGIPEHKPQLDSKKTTAIPTTATTTSSSAAAGTSGGVMYEPPRQQQTMRQKIASSFGETKKAIGDSVSGLTGSAQSSVEEKAERKRKEQIRKLEEKRREQEREHFLEKYKGKR